MSKALEEDDVYRPPDIFEDEEGNVDLKKRNAVLTQRYKDVGLVVSEE